jgi:hypothetical protein
MASTHAKTAAPAAVQPTDVLLQSFRPVTPNGGIAGEAGPSVTLSRTEWMQTISGLTYAAGHAAITRNFDRMIEFNSVCATLSAELRIGASNAAADLPPPPPLARSAAA